jgi:hypothetical protein
MEDYEALQFAVNNEYDREPDVYIPEQRLKDPTTGEETGVVLPPQTVRGAAEDALPHRRRTGNPVAFDEGGHRRARRSRIQAAARRRQKLQRRVEGLG